VERSSGERTTEEIMFSFAKKLRREMSRDLMARHASELTGKEWWAAAVVSSSTPRWRRNRKQFRPGTFQQGKNRVGGGTRFDSRKDTRVHRDNNQCLADSALYGQTCNERWPKKGAEIGAPPKTLEKKLTEECQVRHEIKK